MNWWWRRWKSKENGRHTRTDIERSSAELTGKVDHLISRLEDMVKSLERDTDDE